MNRKISLGVAIAFMAIIAAATFSITMIYSMQLFGQRVNNIKERETMYEKLTEIDKKVTEQYYGDVDQETLMDYIAAGYVAGIGDQYAAYFTAEQYQDYLDSLSGSIVGIGIQGSQGIDGYFHITQVYAGSPAEEVGIQAGDMIVAVEGVTLTSENYETLIDSIQGEAGTTVNLTIRQGTTDTPMSITRRNVEIPSVNYRQIDTVGYIQIVEFNTNTVDQFTRALNNLTQSGVTSLVFDVRNNPGGTLDSVVKILDQLLPEGTIVSATYADGTTTTLGTSDASEVALPMMVLTNQDTASAAELFAQAIKDYNKGRTVGTQTYGKGSMQSIIELDDGSAIRLTVAHYNAPNGENYDGVGVTADFVVNMTAEQEQALINGTLDETTDPQLAKALELARAAANQGSLPSPESGSSETSSSQADAA